MLPQPLRNLGAIPLREGSCSFRVWAPRCERLEVRLVAPGELLVPLQKGRAGYFQGVVAGVGPGARYFYRLDGAKDRPDPASRFQPEGVHGPSQVAAAGFAWEDQGWCGPDLRDYAIYELHVGAYSPEGTLAAIIPHLEELRELGITALELMPVAQFPGIAIGVMTGFTPLPCKTATAVRKPSSVWSTPATARVWP